MLYILAEKKSSVNSELSSFIVLAKCSEAKDSLWSLFHSISDCLPVLLTVLFLLCCCCRLLLLP